MMKQIQCSKCHRESKSPGGFQVSLLYERTRTGPIGDQISEEKLLRGQQSIQRCRQPVRVSELGEHGSSEMSQSLACRAEKTEAIVRVQQAGHEGSEYGGHRCHIDFQLY